MTLQLRSELLKLRTTRTAAGLLAGMVALMLFVIVLHGAAKSEAFLADPSNQRDLLAMGTLGALFAAYVGAISITAELRHGTIRATFLGTPSRSRVLLAKALVAAAAGAAFGLVGQAAAYGALRAALASRGIEFAASGGSVVRLFAGTVALAALWGPLGVALGALVRNQVSTLVGLGAWVLFVELLLLNNAKSVGKFAPLGAGSAIGGAESGLLPPAAGAALLVGYVLALGAAAIAVTGRRDVP